MDSETKHEIWVTTASTLATVVIATVATVATTATVALAILNQGILSQGP